ncbi:hypothetical protein D9758_016960 [Tetrapyrgos nigripes]|uniref:G domain-containing protein n=1 Tax=Tetrapyrgos nigripes TaxID=182062 RepID=A0A8H5FCV0_9AGAR|nr:hypothetical protein D9758_016960 [Tetrapyrgos nigripes]
MTTAYIKVLYSRSLDTSIDMGNNISASNVSAASDLEVRQKYRHFRVLVIGRANAGKTTLLKRVCNTTEEPCIYDEDNRNLLEPTADRGVHNIHRAFAFASNPQFIFHDSPGFEKGGAKELEDVQQFIENRAKATNVEDQLHAVWFCLVTDAARPVLELEERFFREKRFGNVPVIAIFTKFDDLVTQLYGEDKEEAQIYRDATAYVEDKFQKPLAECDYPPSAYLCFEAMQEPNGNHQQQVKELMKKTADSLGDPAWSYYLFRSSKTIWNFASDMQSNTQNL